MVTKRNLAIIGAFIFVIGVLISFVSVVFGFEPVRAVYERVVHQIVEVPEPDINTEGCTQTGTTTLCAQLELIQNETTITGNLPNKEPVFTFGPSTKQFTNEQHGITFRYPEVLELHEAGEIILRDKETGGKNFSLKICNDTTPCGQVDFTPTSLFDFTKERSIVSGENAKGNLIRKETPIKISYFSSVSGETILKRVVVNSIYDAEGTNVTKETCELCSEPLVQYIYFKSPENYTMFWLTQGTEEHAEIVLTSLKVSDS